MTFVIIHIHHAVTRLFPSARRSSRKHTSLVVLLATILTCVPLRGTPSFPPVWQSFGSIVPYMYSSERSPIPDSICGCINLLVRTVPVPPRLSVVASVVNRFTFVVIHICHYSHSPRCDPALSIGQALVAQNTSLFMPLATIMTCVPLRGTPSFPPVW